MFKTLKICGVDYQLRISTANAVWIEHELHSDILSGLEKISEITVLAKYYYAAMKSRNDAINSLDDVYALIDDYLLEGGTLDNLQRLMIEVLTESGIMSKEAYNASKKLMEKQQEALQKLLD